MASEIKVDTIVNAGGDNDTGIDLSTNDQATIKLANVNKAVFLANNMHLIGGTVARIQLSSSGSGTTPNTGNNNVHIEGNDDTLVLNAAGNGNLICQENGTERMRIKSGGNFGFGAMSSSNISTSILMTMTGDGTNSDKYYKVGPHYTGSSPAYYVINHSDVGVYMSYGGNSWSAHSDERIKENITSLENVLPDVKNIRCVKYNLKGQSATKIGFIAQDWESKFSEVVDENSRQVIESDGTVAMDTESESTTKVKAMSYTETIPVLLKAIQELSEKNDLLEARIKKLEGG